MAIKVDFDLATTVVAYNLLRLLALDLPPGYRQLTARSLGDCLLCNAAEIALDPGLCTVSLKKKRDLPALLEALQAVGTPRIPWLGNAGSYSKVLPFPDAARRSITVSRA